MRVNLIFLTLVIGSLSGFLLDIAPTFAQTLSQSQSQGQQQPSQQQIEAFCANWDQLSGSEKKQYRPQYERYCQRDEPVFGQPVAPQPQTNIMQPADPQQQQPPSQQQPSQKPQEPEKPGRPEDSTEPEAREPQIEPAKPEPLIPEPEPLRVDLVGEVALAGPLARKPGERQRFRVTLKNRDAGGGPHAPAVNRLWARVFLSEQDLSRRGRSARAFSFPARQRGRQVPIPGVPDPGESREVMAEAVLPVTLADGTYWWCVQVDARQAVEETDEVNNIACAQKVVAIGGEGDAELSGVFGSKVDEVKERVDRPDVGSKLSEQDLVVPDGTGAPRPTAGDPPSNLPATAGADSLPDRVRNPWMDQIGPELEVGERAAMVNRLTVSGDTGTVTLTHSGEAELDWIFGPSAESALLRINEGPFRDDGACPPSGTPADYGAAAERDANAYVVEGLSSEGSRRIDFGDGRTFSVGAKQFVQLCSLHGGAFTGNGTNTVVVAFDAPDLVVERITDITWHPEHLTYGPGTTIGVTVANRGGSPSRPAMISLKVDLPSGSVSSTSICSPSAPLLPLDLPGLEPHERREGVFQIECGAGESHAGHGEVTVVIDSWNHVTESNEENNELGGTLPYVTGEPCGYHRFCGILDVAWCPPKPWVCPD